MAIIEGFDNDSTKATKFSNQNLNLNGEPSIEIRNVNNSNSSRKK